MAYVLPLGLGVVAAVFLLIVVGEVFYLFYWRKRPLAYPRVNNVTVAPVNESESVRERDGNGELVIDVTCAEYQISALHNDLVEKLFPSLGVSPDSAHSLLGPPRMLFTITEETREELEGLDLDGKGRSRRGSRSKSMSDISLSPLGPLSPLSTPFVTPLSSPDLFSTPYATPTYSPLVNLNRSHSTSPVFLKTSCRIMYDYAISPPPAPPSPTRPTFPFLARPASPSTKSFEAPAQLQTSTRSPVNNKLSPYVAFCSPPQKPFVFHTSPIRGNDIESLAKVNSPHRSNCTYVYENGAFSPTSPTSPPSPRTFPLMLGSPHEQPYSSCSEIQEHDSSSTSPPHSSFDSLTSRFTNGTPPSDTVVFSLPGDSSSPSCKPSSQRSMLFSSTHPFLTPPVANPVTEKSLTGPVSSPVPAVIHLVSNRGTPLSPNLSERKFTPFLDDSVLPRSTVY